MTTEDITTSDSSDKYKKEPSTPPADVTTKPTNEKKVVVITPSSKTESEFLLKPNQLSCRSAHESKHQDQCLN